MKFSVMGTLFPAVKTALVAFRETAGPVGLLDTASPTVPLNPFWLVTNIVTDFI